MIINDIYNIIILYNDDNNLRLLNSLIKTIHDRGHHYCEFKSIHQYITTLQYCHDYERCTNESACQRKYYENVKNKLSGIKFEDDTILNNFTISELWGFQDYDETTLYLRSEEELTNIYEQICCMACEINLQEFVPGCQVLSFQIDIDCSAEGEYFKYKYNDYIMVLRKHKHRFGELYITKDGVKQDIVQLDKHIFTIFASLCIQYDDERLIYDYQRLHDTKIKLFRFHVPQEIDCPFYPTYKDTFITKYTKILKLLNPMQITKLINIVMGQGCEYINGMIANKRNICYYHQQKVINELDDKIQQKS
jgi:hypothetical protein